MGEQPTGFPTVPYPLPPTHRRRLPLLRRFWMGLCIAVAAAVSSPGEIAYPRFALADLQQDFDYVRDIVQIQHPRLYADIPALNAAFAKRRGLLSDQMNELEFLRVLAPLITQLNCGHTRIELSSATQSATSGQRRLLPLSIRVIDGSLFIARALPAFAQLAGCEILTVNGRPAAEIVQQLYDNIPADGANLTKKRFRLNHGYDFATNHYLYVDSAESFTLTVRSPAARRVQSVLLDGGAPADLSSLRAATPTLVDGIGWSEFVDDYALLAVTTFSFSDEPGRARFYAFIDRFFDEVASRRSPNVILDLRGNGGGDPYCGTSLLDHLLTQAYIYLDAATYTYPDLKSPRTPAANAYAGPLYILADGGSFSTTGHVTSLFKAQLRGRFIGEETAGAATCTAAQQTTTLARTQLRLTYATGIFSTPVSGLTPGRGVMPDYEVVPTVEDHVAERDVVKSFALSLIRDPSPAPALLAPPQSHSIASGATAVLSVDTRGSGLRYQWRRNGTAIEGATSRQLVLTECTSTDAGHYAVTVTNPLGSVTSSAAALNVGSAPDASHIVNVSVRTATGPGDQTLIVGFVLGPADASGTNDILVRGLGPQLSVFGVPSVLADPQIQLFCQGGATVTASNDDWAGNALVRDTGAAVGAFPFSSTTSKDAALVTSLSAGAYSIQVTGAASGTVLAEVYDASPWNSPAATPRLSNVSARAQADAANPLIAGFVVSGPTARTVLIRGIGPGLQPFLGDAALGDSKLQVFQHQDSRTTVIAGNSGWDGDPQLAALSRRVGAFALAGGAVKDAVAAVTLDPGVYSVHVAPASDASGIALVEVYAVP